VPKNYNLVRGGIHERFANLRSKVQVMAGGFGNGKTTAVVVTKGIKLATAYPGSNGLIARATYPKLNDTIRKEFLAWCPSSWIKRRPTQDDNTAHLTNGTTVNFRYIAQRGKSREDGSTTSNLLSASYDWIIVDQVEDPEIQYKDFLDLLGRLRGDTPYRPPTGSDDETMPATGPRWLILTANPSRGWFFHEVVKPYQDFKRTGKKNDKLLVDPGTGECIVEVVEGSTYENKHNLAKDYLTGLEAAYRGQMRDRYLLGRWEAFEGLVHGEFDASRHLITRKQALAHIERCVKEKHVRLRVYEGYDYGSISPSCYLLCVGDEKGRVIVFDGFYRADYAYDQQPDEIFSIRWQYRGLLTFEDRINADPAIFRRMVVAGKRDTGDTLAKLFSALGMETRPATNDVLPGIAKINSYLAGRSDVPHIITGETPGPLLYFVDDLQFLQDEIGAYYWKKNPQGEYIDEPMDRNDHAMNTLKYALSRAPRPAEIFIPPDDMPKPWMLWHEEDVSRKGA
jgi:hypothetical protein